MEGTRLDTLGISGRFWSRPHCRTFFLVFLLSFWLITLSLSFLAYYVTILIRVARNTLKYNRTAPSRKLNLDKTNT